MQTEAVSDTFTGAALKRTPTADPVTLVINSLVYIEGDGFTVDRSAKTLTWTDAELTVTASVADEVQIRFKTLDRADAATGPVVDPNAHVYGAVLVTKGLNGYGVENQWTESAGWVLVDKNLNVTTLDTTTHGTWTGIQARTLDSGDEVVEIPATWVKTEVISDGGTYDGCTCWWIADGYAGEGFHLHPAFIKSDGTAGTALQVGKFLTSEINYELVSADTRNGDWSLDDELLSNTTYQNLRSLALTKNNSGTTTGWRAYNIYDHHFLARVWLIEKVGGVGYVDNFHGIDLYDYNWANIDGLLVDNNTYHVLNPNGSGTMIDTNVPTVKYNGVAYAGGVRSCYTQIANGVNFGDLFIGDDLSSYDAGTDGEHSFGDNPTQGVWGNDVTKCFAIMNNEDCSPMMFSLMAWNLTNNYCWRLARVI